jgi:hypothetical protein
MIRLAHRSRWLAPVMLVASLFATAPSVRLCSMPWTDVTVAALATCTGGAIPADATPVHETALGCEAMTGGATCDRCPLGGPSGPIATTAGAEGTTEHAASTGARTRCLMAPAMGSLWRPPLPVVRHPGIAALPSASAPDPELAPTRIVVTAVVPTPAARGPVARPPVRGPPSLV